MGGNSSHFPGIALESTGASAFQQVRTHYAATSYPGSWPFSTFILVNLASLAQAPSKVVVCSAGYAIKN